MPWAIICRAYGPLMPRFDEEAVGGFVVGAFGEFGCGEGLFEVAVEFISLVVCRRSAAIPFAGG